MSERFQIASTSDSSTADGLPPDSPARGALERTADSAAESSAQAARSAASNDKAPRSTPPRPSLTFRVGVVGHRPNRLASADHDALAHRLRELVRAVREEVLAHHQRCPGQYDSSPPVIRAISPLAEGVDRLFAEAALAEGCELSAVLPFEQSEFERDFEPGIALEADSTARFRRLLGRAGTIFQLDGSRIDESLAYETASHVVLNQSDLLIVVWDGERRHLRGGTEETFDRAVERGVPVVWIDAHAPHHWRIVTQPIHLLEDVRPGIRAALTRSQSVSDVKQHVRRLVELPDDRPGRPDAPTESRSIRSKVRSPIHVYLEERQPRFTMAFWWKWFRNVVGEGRWSPPPVRSAPYDAEVRSPTLNSSDSIARLDEKWHRFYAWSDKLADRYADAYRSAFLVAFGLAATAVALALGPMALQLPEHGLGETVFAVGEMTAICLILFIVFRGRYGQWHRRWLDYRLLVEMLRHQRLVAPLGGVRSAPSVPEHWAAYGELGASWMAWYARAVERSLGIPSAVVDREYLQRCLRDLSEQLGGPDGQVAFHRESAIRSSHIEHRLHRLEVALLVATLLCCLQHILQGVFHDWPQVRGSVLTFFCGTFPAFGAALAGISNQGEFRRIAQRSRSMADRLQQRLTEVHRLQSRLAEPRTAQAQISPELTRIASETARVMVNEVLDWRVIFQDRPLRTM